MPSRTVSTLAMYSSGVWSETIGAGRALAARAARLRASRGRPAVETSPLVEIVAVALDLLLLAVHEADVVAEEQVQVLVAVARQLLLDRLELKQQVVAESAHQAQARILFAAEFVDQRAQNGKRRGLLAALLFRKQRRQRLQTAVQRAVRPAEFLPVRMSLPAPDGAIAAIARPRSFSGRNSTRRS